MFTINLNLTESTLPKEKKLKNRRKLGCTAQDSLWVQSSVSRSWHRKHQPVQQGPWNCVVHDDQSWGSLCPWFVIIH